MTNNWSLVTSHLSLIQAAKTQITPSQTILYLRRAHLPPKHMLSASPAIRDPIKNWIVFEQSAPH